MSLSVVVFLAVAHLDTVYSTLFLVYVLVNVCVCVWVHMCLCEIDCVFFSSSATLPLSRSMPGSEVITTEPLHRFLMWCTTQMRAHVHTHTNTHQGQVKTNSPHTYGLVPPFALFQGADSEGKKKQGQAFCCVGLML